jgi:hypothetical protein
MLAQSLERDNFDVFFAPRDIGGGENWQRVLQEELRKADKVVLVLSQHTPDSHWMTLEYQVVLNEGKEKLVPIIIDDSIGLPETQDFLRELDAFLALIQFIDFRVPQHVDSAYEMLFEALLA